MFKGGFIQNLPKIYGLYTGGFAVFIILMAIAEGFGLSAKNIGMRVNIPPIKLDSDAHFGNILNGTQLHMRSIEPRWTKIQNPRTGIPKKTIAR